jgi:inosine/xanthosine triphosphate pyrophosphatase family protein
MKKQILLGTKNQAKINIIQAALDSLPIEILTCGDLDINIEVREDGQSTEENAEKKARAYLAASGVPTVAIDGALRVDQFPEEKQPGVFIKRIHGIDREPTDKEVLDYYVGELDKIGGKSVGTWKGSIALAVSDEKIFSASYSYQTILTTQRKGAVISGAPLDAVTVDLITGKYYTEMDWKERPDVQWVSEFLKQHLSEL